MIFLFVGFFALVAVRYFMKDNAVDDYDGDVSISKNQILNLEINGVIMNGKSFLKKLKKYKKDPAVKAIVIDINSPGGAVGPSQEIYYEIIRAKKETKKPVVCVSTGLIASGGYYAALACDKLLVAPGAMIGSIGVIMEFANLEKLYDWAKVQRYTITSGKFKDSGSEYRPMREDERQLFQSMIDEVYAQFKNTVMTSRNLSEEVVSQYADGRVMTGATAVKLKFADAEGTFEDAVRMAATMAKLGDDYKVVKPAKTKENWWDMILDNREEDELNTVARSPLFSTSGLMKNVFKTELLNQPLYMMPGYW
jgi:protease IV